MIEEMYGVMHRINELRERFGMKRHNPSEAPKPTVPPAEKGGGSFREFHDRAVGAEKGKNASDVPQKKLSVAEIKELAERYAVQQRVPSSLVKAVIEVESQYNPQAVSPRGAKGLMQLMPSVADELGVDDPFVPEENIRGGVSYLRDLLNRYDGDYAKTLAAYNAGPTAVKESNGVPDYKETKEYINKVLKSYVRNAE